MSNPQTPTRILISHFFRRFFDNDTLQPDGDTTTTVVRALSIVAAPGLMIAFFLQNQYPGRTLWGSIEDQYFFVLFSFVALAGVAIFEWEMLFPDRLDFLVLSPLPIRPLQMLAAKATALATFLILFLFAANIFGALTLPAVTRGNFIHSVPAHVAITKGDFFHQIVAHTTAALLAGAFGAFLILALGGILLCILSANTFRILSPLIQMLSIAALALLLIHYLRFGDSIQSQLTPPTGITRWMPPIWFLALYEQLLHGADAPAFAHQFAPWALRATAFAALAALLTYPLAWTRMRRLALEGAPGRRRPANQSLLRLTHQIVRQPSERAIFHFIGQTIARNNRYQVYLAIYCGAGLALALSCATTFTLSNTTPRPAISTYGLHAIMPLFLFWITAGLRAAFGFPLDLAARWIFRITGIPIADCAAAARKWALLCALAITTAILITLRVAHWNDRQLLVQAAVGLALSLLLTDAFFTFHPGVPFSRPRMPGRTSLPLMLTLYVGALTPFIFGVIYLELRLEKNLLELLPLALTVLAIHIAFHTLRKGSDEIDEELEGYEGEFQLLGLS